MKLMLTTLSILVIFSIQASHAQSITKYIKKDTLLNGVKLIELEKLPQGAPMITKLQIKGMIKKNQHYYSIKILSYGSNSTKWYVCSDPELSNRLKYMTLPFSVSLKIERFIIQDTVSKLSTFDIVRKVSQLQ